MFRPLTKDVARRHAGALLAMARDVPEEYWQTEHLLMDLPDKWRLSFVAWIADKPVGFAVLSTKARDHVHLHKLMLDPARRGSGIGTRMIAHMEDLARTHGADRLTLKVHRGNDGARRLYRRLGFAIVGNAGDYLEFEKRIPARPIVAVHQPNYLPWLGYFQKIATADVFVFLDDVQFPKHSYTNRVRVLDRGKARWLTVPVSVSLGDPIDRVRPAKASWRQSHLDALRNYYGRAPFFREVWAWLGDLYPALPDADLAATNRALIESLADRIGLACRFAAASQLGAAAGAGDERLVALVSAVSPGATYLSGRGGANYQDEGKFRAAGLGFRYADFDHPRYAQGGGDFVPGLSALDAAFHVGWSGLADLVSQGRAAT